VIVIEDTQFSVTVPAASPTPSNPLIFYGVSNGENESEGPTYSFALKTSLPGGDVAEIASFDGTTWTKTQGVSIRELIRLIELATLNHIINAQAGENISAGENVKLDGAGDSFVAGTADTDDAKVVGVAIDTVTTGQIGRVLTGGLYTDAGAPFTVGEIHYLNASGTFSDSEQAGVSPILGIAVTASQFVYSPNYTSIEISPINNFLGILKQVIDVPISHVDSDTTRVGFGAAVLGGDTYILNPDVGKDYRDIVMGTDMDNHDHPYSAGAGADVEGDNNWAYIYAKPDSSSTFVPVYSSAPPYKSIRSARILSNNSIGTGTTTGALSLKVDGGSVWTTKTAPGGSNTISFIADWLNTPTNWVGDILPPIRAFVVGVTSATNRLGVMAKGLNVGSNSSIEITVSFGGTIAFNLTTKTGVDWKYLGVVRNNANSDIRKFSYHHQSGMYRFNSNVNGIGYLHNEGYLAAPAAVGDGYMGFFNGNGSVDGPATLVDFSDFCPLTTNKAVLDFFLSGAHPAVWIDTEPFRNKNAIWGIVDRDPDENPDNNPSSGQPPGDPVGSTTLTVFLERGLKMGGAQSDSYVAEITINLNDLQKVYMLSDITSGGYHLMHLGFYDER
jgi:hypothetical protein